MSKDNTYICLNSLNSCKGIFDSQCKRCRKIMNYTPLIAQSKEKIEVKTDKNSPE